MQDYNQANREGRRIAHIKEVKMFGHTGAVDLTKANELISKVLEDLPVGSEIGDDLLEATFHI